jgi:hypothetical protein
VEARPRTARLRARTLADYLWTLERHVLPKLGDARLDAIHTARVEAEVVKPLREAGKIRSAQLAVAVLSKVLGSAAKDPTWGLVGNACRGVEVGRKSRRELRPLDAAERAAFREAIRGTDQRGAVARHGIHGRRPQRGPRARLGARGPRRRDPARGAHG